MDNSLLSTFHRLLLCSLKSNWLEECDCQGPLILINSRIHHPLPSFARYLTRRPPRAGIYMPHTLMRTSLHPSSSSPTYLPPPTIEALYPWIFGKIHNWGFLVYTH